MSHNIDKIFYINLPSRTDRRAEIETELNNYNLEFERFDAIPWPGCGSIGCGKSHIGVLKLAKERGYKNILIFEDDFTFTVSKEEFERNMTNFFNDVKEFDVCMLSHNLIRHKILEHDYISKVIEAQTASGYIINHAYYDILIELFEFSMLMLEKTKQHWIYAIDQIWKPLQENDNWYCFMNRIGKQRPSYSDNGESYTHPEH